MLQGRDKARGRVEGEEGEVDGEDKSVIATVIMANLLISTEHVIVCFAVVVVDLLLLFV